MPADAQMLRCLDAQMLRYGPMADSDHCDSIVASVQKQRDVMGPVDEVDARAALAFSALRAAQAAR